MSERIFWDDSKANIETKYETTTWFRACELMNFIRKVNEEHEILAITFNEEENNIGFVVEKRNE